MQIAELEAEPRRSSDTAGFGFGFGFELNLTARSSTEFLPQIPPIAPPVSLLIVLDDRLWTRALYAVASLEN